MKSMDTNILMYASNSDCREYAICSELVERALSTPRQWIIADQVWFELYRLLRNPTVLANPLGAKEAGQTIKWFRRESGWLHCAWETNSMSKLESLWSEASFPSKRVFDLILALTLKNNGVTEFYTRNSRDFKEFGFFSVINPLELL
jgi:uncharacterized protein